MGITVWGVSDKVSTTTRNEECRMAIELTRDRTRGGRSSPPCCLTAATRPRTPTTRLSMHWRSLSRLDGVVYDGGLCRHKLLFRCLISETSNRPANQILSKTIPRPFQAKSVLSSFCCSCQHQSESGPSAGTAGVPAQPHVKPKVKHAGELCFRA